jgi:hypothetical protein
VEVSCVLARPDVESVLDGVVIGTVLRDSLLAGLRRLAHVDVSPRPSPKAQRAADAGLPRPGLHSVHKSS